jgi:hypothetical protein
MTESAARRTLPCLACGRSRTECRTVDNPFLSCCTTCAANDGNPHEPPRSEYEGNWTEQP